MWEWFCLPLMRSYPSQIGYKAAVAEINIITQKIKIAKSPSYGIFQCYVIVLGDRAPRELKISQNRNYRASRTIQKTIVTLPVGQTRAEYGYMTLYSLTMGKTARRRRKFLEIAISELYFCKLNEA